MLNSVNSALKLFIQTQYLQVGDVAPYTTNGLRVVARVRVFLLSPLLYLAKCLTNGTFQRYFFLSTNSENAYSQYYSQFLFVAGNDLVILFIYEFQYTDCLV